MAEQRKIPAAVLRAGAWLAENYGGNDHFRFLGMRDGSEVWLFEFPDEVDYGFPQVWLYKSGRAVAVEDVAAVRLVASMLPED